MGLFGDFVFSEQRIIANLYRAWDLFHLNTGDLLSNYVLIEIGQLKDEREQFK